MMNWQLPIGAQLDDEGVRFRVWTEQVDQLEVVVVGEGDQELSAYPLTRDEAGYFVGHIVGIKEGTRYMYRLEGQKMRPDPASRSQPVSVHGPSEVVNPCYPHRGPADWWGLPLEELVIYEVHTGTATPQGTFEALIGKLDHIKQLGATAIEIMPVADFPGERNWGYDGVDLFAPARAYGGPSGLHRLIEAAHRLGLAVILDVVYNHLGPDGNYLRDFSPRYFTAALKTPWGDALDYNCEAVREFFIANATYWAIEYGVDGLRLDATHAVLDDNSQTHILQELTTRVRAALDPARHFVIFAEDDRNQASLLSPVHEGGTGLDGLWADDFHHQVRVALAGDREGYYADYTGAAADLARTLNQGWFYTGQISRFSGQARGTETGLRDPAHFVYCIQNHDQIGNRPLGDRLNHSIGPEAYRAASALLLLAPATPLLFQGQEWAASTPFLFFTDHNPELGRLVTEGRRAEFAGFSGFTSQTVPDPQALATFEASKLNWPELAQELHAQTLELYRALLNLRRRPSFRQGRTRPNFRAEVVGPQALALRYSTASADLLMVVNLKGELKLNLTTQAITRTDQAGGWRRLLATNDSQTWTTTLTGTDWQDVELAEAAGPVALVYEAGT